MYAFSQSGGLIFREEGVDIRARQKNGDSAGELGISSPPKKGFSLLFLIVYAIIVNIICLLLCVILGFWFQME